MSRILIFLPFMPLPILPLQRVQCRAIPCGQKKPDHARPALAWPCHGGAANESCRPFDLDAQFDRLDSGWPVAARRCHVAGLSR